MASYTPKDAISMAKAMNHKVPSEMVQAVACDFVFSKVWTAYPWTWTLTNLTAIALTDGVQDYAHAQTDFFRFVNLRVAQTSLTPVEYRELRQKNHLSPELTMKGGLDQIRVFSWEASIGTNPVGRLRLDRAASVPSGTTLQLQGEYQPTPTKINQSTLASAITMPDHYFQAFFEGVRWYLYQLADDPRAGAIQVAGSRKVYTGQLGVFMESVRVIAEAEDFSDGEDLNFPSETLGEGRGEVWPRIFG